MGNMLRVVCCDCSRYTYAGFFTQNIDRPYSGQCDTQDLGGEAVSSQRSSIPRQPAECSEVHTGSGETLSRRPSTVRPYPGHGH